MNGGTDRNEYKLFKVIISNELNQQWRKRKYTQNACNLCMIYRRRTDILFSLQIVQLNECQNKKGV